MMIDLRVHDPKLWEYVCLLQASPAIHMAPIRCRSCQTRLGTIATTKHGPGFSARWTIDAAPPGVVVAKDGTQLEPRHTRRWILKNAEEVTGDWAPGKTGYFAPLAIPDQLPQDYLPLVVRCSKHGDSVVDRAAALSALRTKNPRGIVAKPTGHRFEIIDQQTDGLTSTKPTRMRAVMRFGGRKPSSTTPEN